MFYVPKHILPWGEENYRLKLVEPKVSALKDCCAGKPHYWSADLLNSHCHKRLTAPCRELRKGQLIEHCKRDWKQTRHPFFCPSSYLKVWFRVRMEKRGEREGVFSRYQIDHESLAVRGIFPREKFSFILFSCDHCEPHGFFPFPLWSHFTFFMPFTYNWLDGYWEQTASWEQPAWQSIFSLLLTGIKTWSQPETLLKGVENGKPSWPALGRGLD